MCVFSGPLTSPIIHLRNSILLLVSGPLSSEPLYRFVYFIPLASFGFLPLDIAFIYAATQTWGIIVHTERISKLGWLEYFLVTPSHHRVHHGSNPKYLDKNLGMFLIIWDKWFGTFQPELPAEVYQPIKYGLTKADWEGNSGHPGVSWMGQYAQRPGEKGSQIQGSVEILIWPTGLEPWWQAALPATSCERWKIETNDNVFGSPLSPSFPPQLASNFLWLPALNFARLKSYLNNELNLYTHMSLFEQQSNEFIPRHIGPHESDLKQMLKTIGEAERFITDW